MLYLPGEIIDSTTIYFMCLDSTSSTSNDTILMMTFWGTKWGGKHKTK